MHGWRGYIIFSALLAVMSPGAAEPSGSTPSLPKITATKFHEQCILLGAHRGGRHIWPENTVFAYTKAAERWPSILLEGDLLLSKDGEVVVIHDLTVDRTTNGQGFVKDMTLEELKQLDAAYHFSADGGATFPYRGSGITIPTLKEVLDAAPNHLFLFEMKDASGIAEATAKVIRAAEAADRCVLAAISPLSTNWIRQNAPEIAVCYDYAEALRMLSAYRQGDWDAYVPVAPMMAISPGLERRFQITEEEFKAIREKGVLYLMFTINNRDEMKRLLERGVDSILTDYPDVLDAVIQETRQSKAAKAE